MNDLLLQQINNISIIKHNRDLFRILCGLELEIRRSDGTSLNSSSYSSRNSDELHQYLPVPNNSNYIKKEILDVLYQTHEPQTYICQDGLKKIVIPIVLNDAVVGIVFTGETPSFRFTIDQFNSVKQLLIQFTDYIIKNELTPLNLSIYESNSSSRQKELLERAVKYIKSNFHSNNLTLKEVSTKNGISYHHLSRIFKKELNTTFGQFRSKLRMEAATKLLKNSRLTISQISYTCGFDDPAYFCKVFKTTYGTSPLSFRTKNLTKSRLRK